MDAGASARLHHLRRHVLVSCALRWCRGRVVRQGSAKPCTAVQIRSAPQRNGLSVPLNGTGGRFWLVSRGVNQPVCRREGRVLRKRLERGSAESGCERGSTPPSPLSFDGVPERKVRSVLPHLHRPATQAHTAASCPQRLYARRGDETEAEVRGALRGRRMGPVDRWRRRCPSLTSGSPASRASAPCMLSRRRPRSLPRLTSSPRPHDDTDLRAYAQAVCPKCGQ